MGEFFIITTQLFVSFFMTAQKQEKNINSNKPQRNSSSTPMTGKIERHPFEPFLPKNAKLLMLGSFPPAEHRWTMPFYYPNYINDMWRIVGFIFFNDKEHFVFHEQKSFYVDKLISFLTDKGIALFDTATAIIRTKGTAADKDLEVVENTDVAALLDKIPQCTAIVTTGEKATEVLMQQFCIKEKPKVGCFVSFTFNNKEMKLYRMPSSSRAYPMKIERKAEFYKQMFNDVFECDNQ